MLKKEPVGYTPETFWKAQMQRRKKVQRLSATLSLHYRGVESGAGKGQMIASLPDRFRLEVRDPLGRVHLVAGLNEQQFAVLYPRRKQFHKDRLSGKSYLSEWVGFDYSFSTLLPLMLGNLPKRAAKKGFQMWQWDAKEGLYHAKLSLDGKPWQVWIDPKKSVITKIAFPSKGKSFAVEYLDFNRCCGGSVIGGQDNHFQLAHSMSLIGEHGQSSLDVRWREVSSVDTKWPDQAFVVKVPEDAKPLKN